MLAQYPAVFQSMPFESVPMASVDATGALKNATKAADSWEEISGVFARMACHGFH
jgi:hypothetical protein